MTAETVVFIVFAVAAVAGGLVMVLARNAVYCAIGLLTTMFSMAVFYVLNDAHFVAIVQIIIYAGAVITLFLFVIMFIGVDRAEDTDEQIPLQRPLGCCSPVVLILLLAAAGATWFSGPVPAGDAVRRPTARSRPSRPALRHVGARLPGDRAAADRCGRRGHRPRPLQPPPPERSTRDA